MANEKAVSNEEMLAAILASKTFKEAADSLDISIRTIYERMHTTDFRMMYTDAKAEILRTAVNSVNSHVAEALETVAGIMNDTKNNPAVRLQAAQTIINSTYKLRDTLAISECNFKNGF